ncbi:MAG TPA: MBL fold metallo-hydrolase [Vicinamibacterales bacterium]|jgi:glyoxylase-like metal-dependent hydrolase (beta-lactamase superfamily II)|nr:MBL fold metallo-hydrolase [Vicinamibacterales bacterium]
MILERAAVEPFFKNGFVLGCEDTREAVVIDPGDEVEMLIDVVRDRGLTVRHILLTHAHLDHITGVGRAKAATSAPVWLHRDDNFLYERIVQQGLAFGFRAEPQPPVDRFYDGEGPIRFGKYVTRVRHTPGHCPGGVCLAVSRGDEPDSTLFVGDTLFAGSIGRTDLPGGDMETLLQSIRTVLFSYPDETPVWSGHGEMTTIGHERRTNPFLV